jgi:hypothetical protein
MTNTDFAISSTDIADFDDLPRTLRRERDLREREKRERESRNKQQEKAAAPDREEAPSLFVPRDTERDAAPLPQDDYPAATVKRIDVPFFHMMAFYLKAVVAAIPALILLTAILWGMGQAIKIFFPWLLKAQIFIQFPN